MILRKPYALMIKYFKVIHFLIVILALYINTKLSDIFSFFSDYVNNNYSTSIVGDLSSKYISLLMYIVIFVVVFVLIALIALLRNKGKKHKIYSIALLNYIALIIILILFNGIFNQLETGVINADSARLYRDISVICYILQIVTIVLYIYGALTFNTKNALNEEDNLSITTEDNEEVEINIEFDTYKAHRNFRRFVRETKYYIKENKAIITIIMLALTGYIIYSVTTALSTFQDYEYNEQEYIYHDGLQFSVTNSVITNTDLGGNIIEEGKYFVVVQINIQNNSYYDVVLDTNELLLKYSNYEQQPNISLSEYFYDYGNILLNENIKANHNDNYVIAYEIDEKFIEYKFQISISNGIVISDNIASPTYKIINLKTPILENDIEVTTLNLGEKVSFSNTNIGNSSIQINSYVLTDAFNYTYDKCSSDSCKTYNGVVTIGATGNSSGKTLLVVDGLLELDKSTEYYNKYNTSEEFFDNFATIEYTHDGNLKESKVYGVETDTIENKLFMKVPKEVASSESITLKLTIRNKIYRIVIKN